MSAEELVAHAIFSSVSGVSIALTGFSCDATRELFAVFSAKSGAYPASSPINMALSAALVTAVQAALRRRLINGSLLLNVLPMTFIGVVLSLNAFSSSLRAALVPMLGACLLGLSVAMLWLEMSECRRKATVRQSDDSGRQGTVSWRWSGVLVIASLAAGLMSGWCPPPGPAFMAVLLVQGRGEVLLFSGGGGGGEWRTTASLVTSSASLLRVGLLLLENGASVGPMSEVSMLVLGGLVGLGAGNLFLRWWWRVPSSSPIGMDEDTQQRRSPPRAVFRRLVIVLALGSSIAMTTGGAPDALQPISRPLALAAIVLACVATVGGALWACTVGKLTRDAGGVRGAYGEAGAGDDDMDDIELTPFVLPPGKDNGDGVGIGSDDGDEFRDGHREQSVLPIEDHVEEDSYLDEEDGYLADEGETESRRGGRQRVEVRGGRSAGAGASVSAGSGEHGGGRARGTAWRGVFGRTRSTSGDKDKGGGDGGDRVKGGKVAKGMKEKKMEAPPAQSHFPEGHTVEL